MSEEDVEAEFEEQAKREEIRRLHQGVATEGDQERARAFLGQWTLPVMSIGGATVHSIQPDAANALAQLLADERSNGFEVAAAFPEAGNRDSAILLRRAIGVVSDLARLEPQIRAVLDGYAAAPRVPLGAVPACGVPFFGAAAMLGPRPCALPFGHRGPHGATSG